MEEPPKAELRRQGRLKATDVPEPVPVVAFLIGDEAREVDVEELVTGCRRSRSGPSLFEGEGLSEGRLQLLAQEGRGLRLLDLVPLEPADDEERRPRTLVAGGHRG